MIDHNKAKKSVLVINKHYACKDYQFYFKLFRVPEILNHLKQYREILHESGISVPIWVYSLMQNLKVLTEDHQTAVLNFLINLGLFDRYIFYKGWPEYIIGSDPFISVIAGKVSFKEQALLFSHGYSQDSPKLQLYKVSSYYNEQVDEFCLNSLKKEKTSYNLEELLDYLKFYLQQDWENWSFQLISPHNEQTMQELKSKSAVVKDFLEFDSSLKWLWPTWKKVQLESLRNSFLKAELK